MNNFSYLYFDVLLPFPESHRNWYKSLNLLYYRQGYPGGSDAKESACNAGNPGSIPRSGRSPGEGNGNPLQYSCLENSMGRGAWRATVLGRKESDTVSGMLEAKANVFKYRPWASLN